MKEERGPSGSEEEDRHWQEATEAQESQGATDCEAPYQAVRLLMSPALQP